MPNCNCSIYLDEINYDFCVNEDLIDVLVFEIFVLWIVLVDIYQEKHSGLPDIIGL